jgi:glycosyltransferase involved in cell wall biosynthesis
LGEYVGEAVRSVREQTFTDTEIIVVDDGSTDEDTRRRVEGLAGLPGVAVVRTENRGLSAARNTGIRRSMGVYVCSLDADDRLRPAWLERAVAVLDRDPGLAFASHWVEAFGDRSFRWEPVRCDLPALLDCNVVNGGALLRRTVFDAVGGFDESMQDGCEDWEFWIRVVEGGYGGVIIPEALYEYRQRPDSMSRGMYEGDGQPRLYAQLIEKHRASFERHLLDLVLRREWLLGDVCRRIDQLDIEVSTLLRPALEQRRHELTRAEARLAALRATRARQERIAALEQHVAGLEAESAALRESWSWRVTRPLRRLYELAGLGGRSQRDS